MIPERDRSERMKAQIMHRIERSHDRSNAAAAFLEDSHFSSVLRRFAVVLNGEVYGEDIFDSVPSLHPIDTDSSFLNLVWEEHEVEEGLLGAYVIAVEVFPNGAIMVRGSTLGAGSTILTKDEWRSSEMKDEAIYKAIDFPEIVNIARSGDIEDEDEEQEIEVIKEVLKYIH